MYAKALKRLLQALKRLLKALKSLHQAFSRCAVCRGFQLLNKEKKKAFRRASSLLKAFVRHAEVWRGLDLLYASDYSTRSKTVN
jgi:hypothetical protein